MSAIRIGPARVPSRESPEAAVELLLERNYTACEIDCEGGLSTGEPMVPPWAPSFTTAPRRTEARAALGQSPAPLSCTTAQPGGERQ
jgi:hypothetical protein